MPQGIEATGIKEAIKAAKAVGDVERSRAFKAASAEAAELVVRGARAKASTRLERRAARTALDAVVRSSLPAVRLSSSSFPGAFGAEFGADRNQRRLIRGGGQRRSHYRKGWNQFRPWRGSDSNAGYFLWPSIRDSADDVRETYADLVEKLWSEG